MEPFFQIDELFRLKALNEAFTAIELDVRKHFQKLFAHGSVEFLFVKRWRL